MTREIIAQAIHWSTIIWIAGLLNPLMIVPQLLKIVRSGSTEGISLGFFSILCGLQSAFSVHGFFIRDDLVMISNGLAALSTLATTLSGEPDEVREKVSPRNRTGREGFRCQSKLCAFRICSNRDGWSFVQSYCSDAIPSERATSTYFVMSSM